LQTKFGFRQASSTTCASYHLINNVLSTLNSKLLVGDIFCNLHKAFDSINHDILLSKLEFYGITGTVYNLIKSYLQDRQQRVLVNSDSNKYYSKWEPVTLGVPQGSILGPLVSLLYVNDIPNVISDVSKPVLYADDTSLIITNSDIKLFEKDINSTIQRLNRWFHINLLVLNLGKTYFLQFLTRNTKATDLTISYGNKQISSVDTIKFLGVILDKIYLGVPILSN
jgi:hypothetical protein